MSDEKKILTYALKKEGNIYVIPSNIGGIPAFDSEESVETDKRMHTGPEAEHVILDITELVSNGTIRKTIGNKF